MADERVTIELSKYDLDTAINVLRKRGYEELSTALAWARRNARCDQDKAMRSR